MVDRKIDMRKKFHNESILSFPIANHLFDVSEQISRCLREIFLVITTQLLPEVYFVMADAENYRVERSIFPLFLFAQR